MKSCTLASWGAGLRLNVLSPCNRVLLRGQYRRLEESADMPPPTIQCVLAFCDELVALVDGRHAGNRAGLVIEDLVGDMGRDAEPRHPRHAGPAQIVKPPVLHAAHRIKLSLVLTEVLERSR